MYGRNAGSSQLRPAPDDSYSKVFRGERRKERRTVFGSFRDFPDYLDFIQLICMFCWYKMSYFIYSLGEPHNYYFTTFPKDDGKGRKVAKDGFLSDDASITKKHFWSVHRLREQLLFSNVSLVISLRLKGPIFSADN